ncbi:MAG: SAM-dependent methyltransferase, partial [Chromatiales bacterium]|nr:SAM-dependent methyltransferase [Chromatiales bacterium]
GVSSLMACAATLGAPLAARNDVLSVLPATLSNEALEQRIRDVDAVAIIKVGRHLPRVRAVIEAMGLTANARYVEHATMASEKILPLADVDGDAAPYFSMILLHARGDAWNV